MKNKKIKNLFFVFTIAFFSFFMMPKVSAFECVFCNGDEKVYKQEKQLIERIKIIKSVFGNSIDEITLLSTILHSEGTSDALASRYDQNFDSVAYKNSINDISYKKYGISGGGQPTNNTKAQNPSKELENAKKADLLVVAAIVMADSSGWTGTYNDEAYQKALVGSNLVGNNMEDSPIKDFYNWAFCGIAKQVNGVYTFGNVVFNPLETEKQIDLGDTRAKNVAAVCEHGYIGGMYKTFELPETAQQPRKERLAKEIIDLAHYYKSLVGEAKNATCPTAGNTQAEDLKDKTLEEFYQFIGPIAQQEYSRSGLFPSVTLAQFKLEGAFPLSRLALSNNNIFGIKCHGYHSCSSGWSTQENYGSGLVNVTDSFRKYTSVEEGIADRTNFLQENPRYEEAGVFSATTNKEQVQALKKAGYATDSSYVSKLMSIIQEYNLDKWDVKINTTSSSNICSPIGISGWPLRTIKPTPSDQAFVEMENASGNGNRGQCVWYAEGRAFEMVNALKDSGKLSEETANKIKGLLSRTYGNGGDIYDNAKSVFNSSNDIRKPKSGSYISWKQPGNYGHVAIIEEVNTGANTITISEGWTNSGSCPGDSNWGCVEFNFKTMNLDDYYENFGAHYNGGYNFSGYVYFLEPLS